MKFIIFATLLLLFPAAMSGRISGELAWQTGLGSAVFATPVCQYGRVFVGTKGGEFVCLDESGGRVHWRFKTGDEIYSKAAVTADRVIFGSCDGFVYALDAESGQPVWKFKTGGMVESPVATSGDLVFFGGFDSNFYCVSLADGSNLWKYAAGNSIRGGAAVMDGILFFGDDSGRLHAIGTNGDKVWTYQAGGGIPGTPSADHGDVFAGDLSGCLTRLDAKTGLAVWKVTTRDQVFNGPALTEREAVFCGWDGLVRCLDRKTGLELWSYRTSEGIYPAPTIADGRVYTGGDDGILRCLDLKSGQLYWNFNIGGDIAGTPVMSDGWVTIGSYSGRVCRIDSGKADIDAGIPLPRLPPYLPSLVLRLKTPGGFSAILPGASSAADFLLSNAGRGISDNAVMEILQESPSPGLTLFFPDSVQLAPGQSVCLTAVLNAADWAEASGGNITLVARDKNSGLAGQPLQVPYRVMDSPGIALQLEWGGSVPPRFSVDNSTVSDYAPPAVPVEAWVLVRNPGTTDAKSLWLDAAFSGEGLELRTEQSGFNIGDLPAGESAAVRIVLLPTGGDRPTRGILRADLRGGPGVKPVSAFFPLGAEKQKDDNPEDR